MQSNQPDSSRIPPSDTGGYVGWFLLEIAPIPIGFLIGSGDIFKSLIEGSKGLFFCFVALTLACSEVGGIGQFKGFKTKSLSRVAVGIFAGVWIAAFDFSVVCFFGCGAALHT